MHQDPTVDAAIRCDDEHTRDSYIFIVRDDLSTTAMDHNLIPPFVTREACINARNAPKF